MLKILKNLKYLRFRQANEAVTLAKIIDPIIRKSGFDTENLNDVEEEYSIKTNLGTVKIDRCLKFKEKAFILLQAKPIGCFCKSKRVDYEITIEAALKNRINFIIFTDGLSWSFHKLIGIEPILSYKEFKNFKLKYNPNNYYKVITFLKNLREKGGETNE